MLEEVGRLHELLEYLGYLLGEFFMGGADVC